MMKLNSPVGNLATLAGFTALSLTTGIGRVSAEQAAHLEHMGVQLVAFCYRQVEKDVFERMPGAEGEPLSVGGKTLEALEQSLKEARNYCSTLLPTGESGALVLQEGASEIPLPQTATGEELAPFYAINAQESSNRQVTLPLFLNLPQTKMFVPSSPKK